MTQNGYFNTSFRVSASIWDQLSIADQQTIFFNFLHKLYVSLSCAWWKRYFLMIFEYFSSFLSCKHIHKQFFAGINTQHPLKKYFDWGKKKKYNFNAQAVVNLKVFLEWFNKGVYYKTKKYKQFFLHICAELIFLTTNNGQC